MALLELFAAATGAWVVAADFLPRAHEGLLRRLPLSILRGLRGIRTARSSGDFFRTGRAGGPYRRQLRGKLGGFPGRLAPVAPGWGTY